MAKSRMGEEEGHGNLKLEMTKEVRKKVNVTETTPGRAPRRRTRTRGGTRRSGA